MHGRCSVQCQAYHLPTLLIMSTGIFAFMSSFAVRLTLLVWLAMGLAPPWPLPIGSLSSGVFYISGWLQMRGGMVSEATRRSCLTAFLPPRGRPGSFLSLNFTDAFLVIMVVGKTSPEKAFVFLCITPKFLSFCNQGFKMGKKKKKKPSLVSVLSCPELLIINFT